MQVFLCSLLISTANRHLCADDSPGEAASQDVTASGGESVSINEMDEKRRDALSTAVALNYCRAAFHRIRKDPTAEVLIQEKEKILNNLNLTQVEEKDVISLYTAVLDEISNIEVLGEEKRLYQVHHKSNMQRQLTWDALAFGTELATAQFGSAIRTGANSWWDYRNQAFKKDMDLLKIEKLEVNGLLKRSNQLLDTFWELARKKEIPDRWLVRGDNLDELEAAVVEDDLEVRLRVLTRMKPFMEAYPPYWYYLSRTQQELGKLTEAIETYSYLEEIGTGHFRKDDMLATAMANKAAIQDFLGDEQAIASAEKALNYSTDVWEANLIASRILQRNGQIAMAEDAILRNLDVDLEQPQSTVFLASLYYYSRDEEKIVRLMNDQSATSHLPAPVLLRCAALVGAKRTPPHVMRNILASLSAYPKNSFGREELMLRVGYAWQLHLASLEVRQGERLLEKPRVATRNGYYDLIFTNNFKWSPSLTNRNDDSEIELAFTYPDKTVINLRLQGNGNGIARNPIAMSSPARMQISAITVGDQPLALNIKSAMNDSDPVTVESAKPILGKPELPGVDLEDVLKVPNPFDTEFTKGLEELTELVK